MDIFMENGTKKKPNIAVAQWIIPAGPTPISRWKPNGFLPAFPFHGKKKQNFSPERRRFGERENKKNLASKPTGASRPAGDGPRAQRCASFRRSQLPLSHFLARGPMIAQALRRERC